MVACESFSSDAGGSDRYTCSKRGGGAPRKMVAMTATSEMTRVAVRFVCAGANGEYQ